MTRTKGGPTAVTRACFTPNLQRQAECPRCEAVGVSVREVFEAAWFVCSVSEHLPPVDCVSIAGRGDSVMTRHPNAPRDLLAGLLAVRHGLIDAARLAEAFDAWWADPARPMVEVLVELGSLDGPGRARLDRLVADHLGRLGGDGLPSSTAALGDPEETPSPDFGPATGPAEADIQAGSRSGSRFRVLRPHARGGLGEVFLALDPELNRRVALKELRDHHAHNPASQSRFLLEAEVTGRLEHPGVVPVYGLGRYPDGRPYYATRFIEGETLLAAVARYHSPQSARAGHDPAARGLAFRRLLRAVIDACNTVAYAHSRGVVHRDLKPENIMLGRFGETLVVDWGVAKPLSGPGQAAAERSATTAPSAAGTP